MSETLVIVGRQSSHYTRMVRMLALELGLDVGFEPIHDLMSRDRAAFAGNPALKLPILRVNYGAVFGSMNICRYLARAAEAEADVLWPESVDSPLLLNAHEILAHAMAMQVEVVTHEIVAKRPPDAVSVKRRESLENCLAWMEENLETLQSQWPSRKIILFDLGLFCLLAHVPFRNPMDLSAMPRLRAFSDEFAERASAKATPYRFD